MDDRPVPVDLFILILVAEGYLPPAAWDDLREILTPPVETDPALGAEFAPAEVPNEVLEKVIRPGIARLAADYPRRVAEMRRHPPDLSARDKLIASARADLENFLRDLPNFGIQIVGEIEPLDEGPFPGG